MDFLHVNDEGKIFPLCPNCGCHRELNAPQNIHKVAWKCPQCKEKTPFKINWRRGKRKECREQITIRSIKVFMCDLSLGGISFESDKINVLKGAKLIIFLPLDFIRKGKGVSVVLEIEITFRKGNKYGARFLNLIQGSRAQRNIYCWLMEE